MQMKFLSKGAILRLISPLLSWYHLPVATEHYEGNANLTFLWATPANNSSGRNKGDVAGTPRLQEIKQSSD